jgi:nucleotide-binding universal stress UspA family protein
VLEAGKPEAGILEAAAAWNVDVIVIGSQSANAYAAGQSTGVNRSRHDGAMTITIRGAARTRCSGLSAVAA